MTITPAALRAEIERVAAEKPDHKAERGLYIVPNVDGNWSEGYTPMCIIGTAAENLQPGIFEPLAMEHSYVQSINSNIVTEEKVQEILFGEVVEGSVGRSTDLGFILDVQEAQDRKITWGEAVRTRNGRITHQENGTQSS